MPMELESFFKEGLLWLADRGNGLADRKEGSNDREEGSAEREERSALPEKRLASYNTQPLPYLKTVAQFGLDAIDKEFPLAGLPTGVIHEWAAAQDLFPCSILALLAGNVLRKTVSSQAKKFVVWIGRDIWPTPYLLEQTMYMTYQEGDSSTSKSLLPHCLFIDPPQDKLKLWAIELALRSPAVVAVIADCKKLKFATSRKFALAARQSNVLGLLIRDLQAFQTPSAAASRWLIEPLVSTSSSPCLQLKLLRCKGAQPKTTSWAVELREGICAYEPNQQTLSLHLSSALGNQSGAVSLQEPVSLQDHCTSDADQQKRQSIAH